jgi:anthranilate synthase component 2
MGFDMVQVSPASVNLCTMEGKTILLVDNRDSFTWNLAHDLERAGAKVVVRQAAECRPEDAEGMDGIVLSPGPGLPSESEGLMPLVAAWATRKPMLGVCLGLQALVEWSGGRLRQLDAVRHGVSSEARRLVADPMLGGIGDRFDVGHYHSWCADRSSLPGVWTVTAEVASDPAIVLALRHDSLPLHAVQFHPESVLTPDGRGMLAAWLATLG